MSYNRWRLYLKALAWILVCSYLGLNAGRILDAFVTAPPFGVAMTVYSMVLAACGGFVMTFVFWFLEEIRYGADSEETAHCRRCEHGVLLAVLGLAGVLHLVLHFGGLSR